jgi:hypothetical protein
MGARLHLVAGDPLFVDEPATEAALELQGEGYAELHKDGKPVFVNPATVAYIDEAGTPQVHA